MNNCKNIKLIKRYSESLKLKLVSDVESGRCTMAEASRHYGVNKSTVLNWVRKYSDQAKRTRVITVVPKDEKDKIKELEAALAESHLRNRLYEKIIEHASEHHGYDIKKNFSTPASKDSKKKGSK